MVMEVNLHLFGPVLSLILKYFPKLSFVEDWQEIQGITYKTNLQSIEFRQEFR